MAVTKTHPIKTTLNKAIAYICNPGKTDETLLVSSFGCSAETADIEFSWTRRHAIDKGTNLGRHLIQAFSPGEVTPKQAHEIGMKLANEVLGGKYEFVLTTHIDKGHIHNHIIFNSVSFVDYRKYHSNKQSYHFIRRTSDRLCKEYGLSVIVPGQERFTRLKTLGVDYTEEAVSSRIAGGLRPSKQPKLGSQKISLLIDIQNNLKAQESGGFAHWAKINNLKEAARTFNFLTEHGITHYEQLQGKVDEVMTEQDRLLSSIKAKEQRIGEIGLLIKHVSAYREHRPVYEQYRKSSDKEKFLRGQESQIILFESAAKALKQMGVQKLPDITALKKEMDSLTAEKQQEYGTYQKIKVQVKELDTIKRNVDQFLSAPQKEEREKNKERG